MLDPMEVMEVMKKHPAIPTALPSVTPEPDIIYQKAGSTGTNTLW